MSAYIDPVDNMAGINSAPTPAGGHGQEVNEKVPLWAQQMLRDIGSLQQGFADLRQDLLLTRQELAQSQTHNRECMDGVLYAFRELPTDDGTLPSQRFPNVPRLDTVYIINGLADEERTQLLQGWGLPTTGNADDRRMRLRMHLGVHCRR